MRPTLAIGATIVLLLGSLLVTTPEQDEEILGTSDVAPQLQLDNGEETIGIYLSTDGEVRYRVTSRSGEVKANLLTLDQLRAVLPGAAERVGKGMADFTAENFGSDLPSELDLSIP